MDKLVNSIFQFSPFREYNQKTLKNIEFGQVSYNLKDFLSDLTINLASVELVLVQRFIEFINQEFIKKSISYFNKFKGNEQYQDYCQGIIIIFINVLKLLESFKLSVNSTSHEKNKTVKAEVEKMLCTKAISISSWLPSYVQFLLQKNERTLNYTSGQRIEKVGILKYRILQLIEKIFSINQIESLNIQFQKFDFFPVILTFIDRYKWNSIAHNLIVKITQHLISQDYDHFKARYLQNTGVSPSKSLFGQLIMHFRNRKFIFLHSLRMINQGHRSLIFRVSRIIILEMQERNDLNKLIELFKIWKQYMQTDLINYQESNYEMSQCYELDRVGHGKATIKSLNDVSTTVFQGSPVRPLETFQQILIGFKEQEKWSPKQVPNKRRKQSLITSEQIKQIDSLVQYLPPA